MTMFLCHQSSMRYGRVWKEKDVMGYWLCPAEKDEFNTEREGGYLPH